MTPHAQTGAIRRGVRVPMRDGVRLATDIFLPGAGSYPVVLVRTAYSKTSPAAPAFTSKGMAYVCQDVRGRYQSGGEWYPFVHEAEDGFDTLEWIGRQPWCNGKIGMFGDSYLAATQFLAAPEGSEFLCALNPRFMTGDGWKRAYYCDGAFSLALTHSWLCFEVAARTSDAALLPLFDPGTLLRELPLISLDEECGCAPVPFYRDYVRHARYDDFWKALSIRDKYHRFTMPVLLTAGWYDYYPLEAVTNYLGLREHASTPALRDSHRLLIGPWTHGVNPSTTLGELDFGAESLAENDATHRWLECLLTGDGPSAFQEAPVRIFAMGDNRWRDEYEWPPARTQYVRYYLHSGGAANSLAGDGTLSPSAPRNESPDHYTYDPDNPVLTLGGNHSIGPYNPGLYEIARPGPFDQRPVERRDDVLVYTSGVLEVDTEVTGSVQLVLCAATSAPDTDFVARLCDVYPDGRSMNITEGVIRARFRESVWEGPKLLEPNRAYQYAIDLQVTSNVFKKGHRIRLDLTSSNFPLWDRNPNTGHEFGMDAETAVAEQTIYHDREQPSYLVLPIISQSAAPGAAARIPLRARGSQRRQASDDESSLPGCRRTM
jgi:putative CocE/NonD family hydrolase